MRLRVGLIAVWAMFTALVCQAEPDVDVPGAKDSAIISRYQGSWLIAEEIKPFDETLLPSIYEFQNDQWVRPLRIEGAHTRIQYVAPAGRSVLEVQRNYEAALQKAGAVKVLSCSPGQACETVLSSAVQPYVTWSMELPRAAADVQAYNAASAAQDKFHHALFKLNKNGVDIYVSVLTSEIFGVAAVPLPKRANTFIDVVEPKAMETDKVSVISSEQLQNALQSEGKIALYGVYFDTGSAVLKPESKAQLDEMAKLLNQNKKIKVFIVGHTDNQGNFDANIKLSQQRAEAVAQSLVKNNAVDAARLVARGVANLAPEAVNDSDAGRAKNRRVELVLQ